MLPLRSSNYFLVFTKFKAEALWGNFLTLSGEGCGICNLGRELDFFCLGSSIFGGSLRPLAEPITFDFVLLARVGCLVENLGCLLSLLSSDVREHEED